MERLLEKKGFICDMDGVIYHGNRLLPGVREFVDWLYREGKEFLFLTNNSGGGGGPLSRPGGGGWMNVIENNETVKKASQRSRPAGREEGRILFSGGLPAPSVGKGAAFFDKQEHPAHIVRRVFCGYRWYSKSRSYRLTRSPSLMPISSRRSKRPAERSIRSNQFLDS